VTLDAIFQEWMIRLQNALMKWWIYWVMFKLKCSIPFFETVDLDMAGLDGRRSSNY
jgi:hypothetical protein